MAPPLSAVAVVGMGLGWYCALVRVAFSARGSLVRDRRIALADVRASASAYPKWLIEPPRHAVALATLAGVVIALVYTLGLALDARPAARALSLNSAAWWLCVAEAVHTATVLFHVYSGFGAWVGVSFTMTSFSLIMTHCFGAALSPWSAAAAAVARALRFPMLAFNGVTFCVWWGVLFPGGTLLLRGRARAGFVKMQREWGMVNIHGLNLPLAVVQGLLVLPHGAERAEPFGFFDLWIAVACAVAYLIFYIVYLEPSGAHLYIILSPRTPLALPVYALLLASIVSLWLAFSRAVDEGWLEDLYVR